MWNLLVHHFMRSLCYTKKRKQIIYQESIVFFTIFAAIREFKLHYSVDWFSCVSWINCDDYKCETFFHGKPSDKVEQEIDERKNKHPQSIGLQKKQFYRFMFGGFELPSNRIKSHFTPFAAHNSRYCMQWIASTVKTFSPVLVLVMREKLT